MKAVTSQGVIVGIALILAFAVTMATAQETGALTLETIKKAREEAAHRHRRIIFNNDGGDATVHCKEKSFEAFLDCRTSALADTQVDTIVYCTSRGTFGMFTHRTEIGETFVSTADRYSNNVTGWMIEQGTDPLQVIIDWCREHDKEVFWGMRVNDTHDSWGYRWEDLTTSKIKKEHPEWLVSSRENKAKVGGFKAADFTHPEIRDYTVRFVEEVCQNYDVDGVDLDFFRHPVFFKSHAWGKGVTQEERDMMTDMMGRIRTMMDEEGVKRGRPFLLSVRVPDSAEYCRAIGLDIERWLQEGLIDMMSVGGYFHLNPWEVSVDLGHQYGVPVRPSLDETRFKDKQAKKARASSESLRGRAMNAWAAGADGVYLFNHFNPKAAYLSQIGSPKTLARLDKVFTTGARGINQVKRWHVKGMAFVNRNEVSPENPKKLKPGTRVRAELPIGEVIPDDNPPKVVLQLRVKDLPDPEGIVVRFNGEPVEFQGQSDVYLDYRVDPSAVQQGMNYVAVEARPGIDGKAVIEDVLVWVRYGDK